MDTAIKFYLHPKRFNKHLVLYPHTTYDRVSQGHWTNRIERRERDRWEIESVSATPPTVSDILTEVPVSEAINCLQWPAQSNLQMTTPPAISSWNKVRHLQGELSESGQNKNTEKSLQIAVSSQQVL